MDVQSCVICLCYLLSSHSPPVSCDIGGMWIGSELEMASMTGASGAGAVTSVCVCQAYDDAQQYSYDVDAALWQQQQQQQAERRVRRQVSNETSGRGGMPTDNMAARDDSKTRYDGNDYYDHAYVDNAVYDDYQLYVRELTHYNKVRHLFTAQPHNRHHNPPKLFADGHRQTR